MADKPHSTPGENPNQPPPIGTPPAEKPAEGAAPVAPTSEAKPGETPPAPESKPAEAKPSGETPPPAAAKPGEEKPPETPPEGTPPDPNVVPEKYELIGFEGKPVDAPLVDALTPILKEAGVKAGQAQALISAYSEYAKNAPAQMAARDLDALKADPELGKLNFGRTQARVNDALAAFTLPAERAALTAMGLANNPVLVRMFHRIGAAMGEPPQTDSGARVPEPRSRASRLYGGGDAVTPTKSN